MMTGTGGMLAAAILKVAVGKVVAAAGDRIMQQWRFSEDLEYMRETLESIEAVLEDAERQSITDKSVRLWLERLTRASYDISDMFDEFEVDTTSKSALRKFRVLNLCLKLPSEVRMSSKMKKVREQLEKISNERQKYSFSTSSSSNVQRIINERETSPEVTGEEILGRDQEKQKIIALLTRNTATWEFIILPMYGIGGIGKTTLAQLLFHDAHFKDYDKAWVYVSQTFDLTKIKKSVRSQLQMEQGQLSESDTREQHAGPSARKNLLIVLDDLWEEDDFKLDDLKNFLKVIGNGHKLYVIATTRDAGIAEKVQTHEAHKIDTLSLDVCWTIIKQIVCFEKRSDKEMLEVTGKQIAEKCGGVALAARAVGYILRSRRDFHEWVSVKDSGFWNASTSGSSPYDNVLASLKLSYSSMLPHLRLCFTYCAIFPKGHEMAKDELIYQWIALGFIKPSDGLSLRQHGENCIKQLLEMSFFQQSKSPSIDGKYGKDVQFTMHDLVHDLARLVMGNELLDASTKCNNIRGRSYRYAFLADCSNPLNSFVTYPDKIRALRFLGGGETGHYHAGFSTAKYLKVLDFQECSLEKLSSSIGQLKLLRYLNAPGIKDQVIPSCTTKLSKLIFLSLRGSHKLLALPESIVGMEGLMYLDLSGCSGIRELPESLGSLKHLVHIDFSNCSHVTHLPKSVGKLENLTRLNLSGCEMLQELPESFQKLGNLVHLDLSSCSSLNGVLKELCCLTKLQYLNLSEDGISFRGLSEVIRKLIELRYLVLSNCSGKISNIDDFFDSVSTLSNLEHLDMSYNDSFETIPDSFCSLRKLHTLDLTGCMSLSMLPRNISRMDSLKFLIVDRCYRLDRSTLPINKSSIPLPDFVVHAFEGEQSSNLVILKDVNPHVMEISRLENVKSIEEARIIELREKRNLVQLTLDWTSGSKGFVEDMELLGALTLPSSLKSFVLRGYNSVSFPPAWPEGIAIYLTNLSSVTLKGLSQCSSLPPLGQLPNLSQLHLEAMHGLRKIDRGFCGHGVEAFARLNNLTISNMENLEEWTVAYSKGEDAAEEFMFPRLLLLTISRCPKLRVGPCPPRVGHMWKINDSEGVLLQCGESAVHTGPSTSSALVQKLRVESCMTPMHQWKLLHHLPGLDELTIENCSDLSSSPDGTGALVFHRSSELSQWLGDLTALRSLSLIGCPGIQALPERLGDLVSLKRLSIIECEGLKSFPESIKQLLNLKILDVWSCPELHKWCELEENETKIAHIEQVRLI